MGEADSRWSRGYDIVPLKRYFHPAAPSLVPSLRNLSLLLTHLTHSLNLAALELKRRGRGPGVGAGRGWISLGGNGRSRAFPVPQLAAAYAHAKHPS